MKKILILDDEADILDLWFSKIKSWDLPIEIHSASNGVEALKLIEAVSKYDLIITDYKMPKMDGLEFIKTIRKNDKYKTVPIFFFTGYLPELSKYQSEFENVMLFEKPNVTDKMRTHLKMCLAI